MGLSPLESLESPRNRATLAHGVTSAVQLRTAQPVRVTGCQFGPVRFSGMNAMTRVIGAALLALRAYSCPVRLGSHLSGDLSLGRYS